MLQRAFILLLLIYVNDQTFHHHMARAVSLFSCEPQNARFLQLLSYVCNKTQSNIQIRDACYGCYFRAVSLAGGSAQLIAVSQCSNIYLFNSSYGNCGQNLATSIVGLKPIPSTIFTSCATTGYCSFVRCLRRVNSADLINSCFLSNLVNRDFNQISNRINFFTNTTACILARARCSHINPITGDIQQQNDSFQPAGTTNLAGTAAYFSHNALQISRSGDLKIVAFPASNIIGNAFCSSEISLDQSTYNIPTCH